MESEGVRWADCSPRRGNGLQFQYLEGKHRTPNLALIQSG